MWNRSNRVATALAVAVSGVLVASCASLPTDSAPQVIRRFDAPGQASENFTPTPDSDPDILLRDFFSASAVPAANYEGARSFLTDQARQAWDPSASTIVVDRISVNTLAGGADTLSFNVQGNVVGELRPGGAFVPARQGYEATMEVERVGGQWRISSLPAGVVIERSELRSRYQPYNLFYYELGGQELVPDRRWVFADRSSVETALATLLLDGPSERVSPVLRSEVPQGATYIGKKDGAYTFTGFGAMGEQERLRFASQLVWTLAGAGITRPISIVADGDPLVPGRDTFSHEDFAESSPLISTPGDFGFYTLANGRLYSVEDEQATPMDNRVAEQGAIVAADVTNSGDYAVVSGEEGRQSLRGGTFDRGAAEIMTAESFTRPSLEKDGGAVWVVADGKRVVRAGRSAAGDYVTSDIAVDFPTGVDGNISVLRLSGTGVRVLLVIDGSLYTGIVEQDANGARRVSNVLEYAPDLAGSVIAADWQPDGSILVGTSNPAAPVVRVEQDGSGTTGKPIGNITAPVVAVAAGGDLIYATDANAVLQMPANASDEPNWREVPGLQGVRSAPIVAQ